MAAFRRIANLFRRPKLDREIADELQSHIDLRIEANLAAGMSPEDARRDALLRFGNPTSTKERIVALDVSLALAGLWRDIRYAARQLRKSPGFTFTVIATLAVGIGANVAIFSSMDAVVLRPLAVPRLDRVVTVAEQQRGSYHQVALANYEDWARQSHSFEGLAAYARADMSLTDAGDPTHVQTAFTSASFFTVLQAKPLLGRVFTEGECQPGRDAEAVLNYGFWQRRFGSDATIVGRRVELDQRVYTVIGVMPKTMQYPPATDLFVPLAPTPKQLADRSNHNYLVTGRLREGVTVKKAQAEMHTIAENLARDNPATNVNWSVHVEPLLDDINGEWTPLYYRLILGATLFVLLVVCANVANLQLARGIARRTEIAMRTALGARRLRIIRQMLTENILLALVGALGGIGFGAVYLHITVITMPVRVARYIPGWSNTSLNGRALVFSLALAGLAGIAAGLAPTLDALRVNPVEQLKAGARGTVGGGRNRMRNLFAVAQIALAVALVIGAGLLSKGMFGLLRRADVYRPDKVLTFSVSLPTTRYDTPQKQAALYTASLTKLRALPGVRHAEVTTALPYSDNGWVRDCEIENRPTVPGKFQSGLQLPVSSEFFAAFHIPIADGRGFNQGDSINSTPVAIVSRRFVTRYFPNESPLGHRIRMGGRDSHDAWLTIVGVAEEVNYALWTEGQDRGQQPAVYISLAQMPPMGATFAIMTDGNPLSLAVPARAAVAAIDPALPLDGVMTWEQNLHEALTGLIYVAVMLAVDALIALLLAAIGIFAVMANLVGERTREIGVRLAMGARKEDVLFMMLRRASWLTGAGVGLGLASAFVLARLVANLLRGVRPDDPVIFAGVTGAIVALALAASWLPARRASRVDPMQALRAE